MRLVALVTSLTLAAAALAQQPDAQPKAAPDAAIAQPEQPPMPKPIPVPDGPVVNKAQLEGGLIVEDLKIGDGIEVKPNGIVCALYHGTLKDGGREFDSAFKRGEPITFPLNGVIKGWTLGVPGMKVGGIRRLIIPSALGYGARGAGQDIPPNADLVFIIQLVATLQIEDVKVGEGAPISGPSLAVTSYTMKDKDGKEVERADASKPYIWIPGEYQPVTYGLDGMKIGGHRRITVPKEMNVVSPQIKSTRPANIPLVIDIELINFRSDPGSSPGC